jgi:hypothetical protein
VASACVVKDKLYISRRTLVEVYEPCDHGFSLTDSWPAAEPLERLVSLPDDALLAISSSGTVSVLDCSAEPRWLTSAKLSVPHGAQSASPVADIRVTAAAPGRQLFAVSFIHGLIHLVEPKCEGGSWQLHVAALPFEHLLPGRHREGAPSRQGAGCTQEQLDSCTAAQKQMQHG